MKREGPITCNGGVLGRYGRKMGRVTRSPVEEEEAASRNALGPALWRQSNLCEWIYGIDADYMIKSDDVLNLRNPFGTGADWQCEPWH